MAAAVATVSVVTTGWDSSKYFHLIGVTINASPATYTTGGIAFNLNHPLIKASRTLSVFFMYGLAGYMYIYVKGTDNSNGLLKIFAQTNAAAAGDPLGELANGSAIPAAVSGDTIVGWAVWAGQL